MNRTSSDVRASAITDHWRAAASLAPPREIPLTTSRRTIRKPSRTGATRPNGSPRSDSKWACRCSRLPDLSSFRQQPVFEADQSRPTEQNRAIRWPLRTHRDFHLQYRFSRFGERTARLCDLRFQITRESGKSHRVEMSTQTYFRSGSQRAPGEFGWALGGWQSFW